MNQSEARIAEYTDAVASRLVGPRAERRKATDALRELLADAAEAGELEDRLDRLGPPDEAARAFSRDRTRPLAPVKDRMVAAALDNVLLIGVAVGLFVGGISSGAATLTFPPFVYIEISGGCIALAPPCPVYNGGWVHTIGLPLALAWSIVGLGLLESWTGVTPAKRLMKMRVVTEDGVRLKPYDAIIRRLSFLVGPFAWLDWIPALWGDRQRVMDRVSAAKVIQADATPEGFDAPRDPYD